MSWGWVLGLALPCMYIAGVASAVDALLRVRNPQGATAWILGLLAVPFLALPLYWMFGRIKYQSYIDSQEQFNRDLAPNLKGANGPLSKYKVDFSGTDKRKHAELAAYEAIATTPWCDSNELTLLRNGEAAFDAIFRAIDNAERYVLVQFFIVRHDDLGERLAQHLTQAAERGCRVYLQFDEIGSHGLSQSFQDKLNDFGVHCSTFSGTRSRLGRFRLNFRNHRKIVVVDGKTGFLGGLNVGDEYLGNTEAFGHWRDTHLGISGPSVLGLQLSFVQDWFFGHNQDDPIDVSWDAFPATGPHQTMISATGPADRIETCGLMFTHSIESAESRLWIASPYFVPDPRVLAALQLAALRGVDVRIILPRTSDNPIFKYVPYAFLQDIEQLGVKIYLYEPGFMHQKVIVVDDCFACIGTANLDNRSFRLNFETTCIVHSPEFVEEVAAMLTEDFAESTLLRSEDITHKPWHFDLAVAVTRLMAPVL